MNQRKAKALRRKIYGDMAVLKVQDREYKVVGYKDTFGRVRSRYLEQGLRGKYQAAKREAKRG